MITHGTAAPDTGNSLEEEEEEKVEQLVVKSSQWKARTASETQNQKKLLSQW